MQPSGNAYICQGGRHESQGPNSCCDAGMYPHFDRHPTWKVSRCKISVLVLPRRLTQWVSLSQHICCTVVVMPHWTISREKKSGQLVVYYFQAACFPTSPNPPNVKSMSECSCSKIGSFQHRLPWHSVHLQAGQGEFTCLSINIVIKPIHSNLSSGHETVRQIVISTSPPYQNCSNQTFKIVSNLQTCKPALNTQNCASL